MDVKQIKTQLAQQAEMIAGLAVGIPPESARWRPDDNSWSLLEVFGHLYDEEREDFRAHFAQILSGDGQPWLPISPMAWVSERAYNQRDWSAAVAAFLEERRGSLAWLESLGEPDLSVSFNAPWGAISAGDVLASWAAHDWLHIRQIVELRRALLVEQIRPYDVDYAGEW